MEILRMGQPTTNVGMEPLGSAPTISSSAIPTSIPRLRKSTKSLHASTVAGSNNMVKPRKTKNKGLPRALASPEDASETEEAQSPEDFVREMFGSTEPIERQDGLPTLEWLKAEYTTKSAAIRYLTSLGHPVRLIAKHLGLRYQHVRNVATSELKRGPNEDWRPKKPPHNLSDMDVTKK
jgi:hypothetical protein